MNTDLCFLLPEKYMVNILKSTSNFEIIEKAFEKYDYITVCRHIVNNCNLNKKTIQCKIQEIFDENDDSFNKNKLYISHPHISLKKINEILEFCDKSPTKQAICLKFAIMNPNFNLSVLSTSQIVDYSFEISLNPNIEKYPDILSYLLASDAITLKYLARNENLSNKTYRRLYGYNLNVINVQLAKNPSTPDDIILKMMEECEEYILSNIHHTHLTDDLIIKLLDRGWIHDAHLDRFASNLMECNICSDIIKRKINNIIQKTKFKCTILKLEQDKNKLIEMYKKMDVYEIKDNIFNTNIPVEILIENIEKKNEISQLCQTIIMYNWGFFTQ